MLPEWREVTVEELSSREPNSIAIGPFGSRMKSDLYVSVGIPVIRGTNLTGGRALSGEFVHVSRETALTLRNCLVKRGDLVFPHRGAIGEVGLITSDEQYLLSTSLMKLTADAATADPLFLYYFFRSPFGRHELLKNASTVGTPGIATPLASLRRVRVILPPLQEQRRIAEILGALDDKIELNWQMNETLEAIAKTLFRERFKDVPAEGAITEIATVISGGTPATDRAEYWNGEYPWASAKDVSQCGEPFLIRTERSITRAGLEESATTLVEPLTTVVVARGATTGRMVLFGSRIAMNQTCYGLRTTEGEHYFLYCLLREHMSTIVHAAHGSVFDTITTATLRSSRVPLPDPAARMRFHSDVAPLFERILMNQRESDTLAQLRDTLLPKLLSGEIRVGAAEKEVAAHV